MKHLKKFNELKKQTYADIMNNTEKYPWVKFLGNSPSSDKKASKMENINNLAREHFTKEFMKEFKKGIEIKNGDKTYKFNGIKFNSNWTNYELIFEGKDSPYDTLFIKFSKSSDYYLGYNIEDKLNKESKLLIKSMFRYMKNEN